MSSHRADTSLILWSWLLLVLLLSGQSRLRFVNVSVAPAATPCTDAADASTATYIRQGAGGAGSGADWTNALTTLPTTLTRGRTYCVADTTTGFGAWSVTSHASGSTYTKIVKATIADHGTATGWLDTMGDGQAIFSAASGGGVGTFNYNVSGSGFLEINGQLTTCGAKQWAAGGSQTCGLQFNQTTTGGAYVMRFVSGGQNSIIRYTEARGPSGDSTADFNYPSDAVGIGGGPADLTISNSYIHNNSTNTDAASTNEILEYSLVSNSRSNNGNSHSNVMFIGGDINGLDIRYNVVTNYNDEGLFLTWFSSQTGPRNVRIYGNIMYSPSTTNPRGVELRQADGAGQVNYADIVINNNTFADLSVAGIFDRSGETFGGTCTSCSATNNISVNAGNSFTNMTSSNNTNDSTTSRFVAYGTNFHLTAALAGTALGTIYNMDLLGNTRGADGTWDRGAYEFCSGGCTFARLSPRYFPWL